MRYYGNLHVKGDSSILGLNANPNIQNPYSGWVTYDIVGENVYQGAGLYFDLASNNWKICNALNLNTLPCRGVALEDTSSGKKCPILRYGIVYIGRWNFLNSWLYISENSNGAISHERPTSIGSYVQCVGTAKGRRVAILDFCTAVVEVG